MVDVELSEAIAREVRPKPRDKNCFLNAYRARFTDTARAAGAALYVDGFAETWPGGAWVPHGWVETEDGRIIEVTPSWLREAGERRYRACRRFIVHEMKGSHLPLTDLEAHRGDLLSPWASEGVAGEGE
jgi:hypothetical protein